MKANGLCMRCLLGAVFCPSGINSTTDEQICKGRDRQYGVYSMLAVVINFLLCLPDNHHRLYALCVHRDPSIGGHPSGY